MSIGFRCDSKSISLETTRSVCPVCLKTLDATIISRDGRVFLKKDCREHGAFEVLLSSDAEWYRRAQNYNRAGTLPRGYSTEAADGCPWDCGICPEHKQHTCLALIEVTSECNLNCPVCVADSRAAFRLSVAQVERMLNRFIELESEPGVIQFSGGEPTLHPDILAMLRLAKKKGLRMVMLNTNGIRIARDDVFLARLADIRPTIYLQFDGFDPRTNRLLRGKDLLKTKLEALDRMAQAKLDVVLVPTIAKTVNHEEIGRIVRFGMQHPAVHGIAFQPMTFAGRYPFDPLERETVPDIISGIAEQTDGLLEAGDFIPVPCCHPTCRSATYIYMDGAKVTPLPRIVEVSQYLDCMSNRTFPAVKPELLKAVKDLWSSRVLPGSAKMVERFRCACGLPLLDGVKHLKKSVFTIVIQEFGDAYSLDLSVLKKCCIGVLVPDGRIIPLCAYNSLGYRDRVRAALAAGEIR